MDFSRWLAVVCSHGGTWGYPLVFLLMAVESSFIPFPSEVVMIPAGFLAARGEMALGSPAGDFALSVAGGVLGALAGAYVNYFLARGVGEPFLRKYGRYFFLKPQVLDRAQEIFLAYGRPTTFVCRLLPGIRQLISLPAGLAGMPLGPFTGYTALGAGAWNAILVSAGFALGRSTAQMDYGEITTRGKVMVMEHYGWVLLGAALFLAAYFGISRLVMKSQPTCRRQEGAKEADTP